MEQVMNCPNVLQSLKADVEASTITLRQAAEELCTQGWSNFVDEDRTRRLLKL